MNLPIAILFRAFLSSNTTALRNLRQVAVQQKIYKIVRKSNLFFKLWLSQHVEQRPKLRRRWKMVFLSSRDDVLLICENKPIIAIA